MDKQKSNAFMLKLVGDVSTALAGALLVVGDRAGLFKAMANAGALTPAALAERSGIGERYVQEWLAVMAGAGYVEYDAELHSFTLPDEHALFLADSESEYYLASLFQSLPTMAAAIPQLVDAFKHGGGVSFKDYGSELPRTLADMNRTVYESRLVKTWMPFMPEVVQRLQGGGRALDVGCGMGVVPLALARGFPAAHITGIDVDAHSIALAKARSAEIDDPQRLQYQQLGVEELPTDTGWDFISTFDVIHDLPDPVAALGHMRRALNQGGTYLMVEPKVADDLKDNLANPFARMLYGISCLHCVPQSLASGGLGLGACWGEKRARSLAAQAGFQHFERLDIRSPALAFYALRA